MWGAVLQPHSPPLPSLGMYPLWGMHLLLTCLLRHLEAVPPPMYVPWVLVFSQLLDVTMVLQRLPSHSHLQPLAPQTLTPHQLSLALLKVSMHLLPQPSVLEVKRQDSQSWVVPPPLAMRILRGMWGLVLHLPRRYFRSKAVTSRTLRLATQPWQLACHRSTKQLLPTFLA